VHQHDAAVGGRQRQRVDVDHDRVGRTLRLLQALHVHRVLQGNGLEQGRIQVLHFYSAYEKNVSFIREFKCYSRSQSYDCELQRQRCKKNTTQQVV
jgi:hypothetical protein